MEATSVNKDIMKGKLKQLRGEIKRRWGELTDDDFTQVQGDFEKLIGMIQMRSGERREVIEEWFRGHGESRAQDPNTQNSHTQDSH
jgi:uncharacterized protein YjbJ (UPF0337 family)